MAFTLAQKATIRRWLGATQLYFDSQPLLQNAMGQIESDPQVQALVEADLAELATLDAKLADVGCLATVEVGNIKIDPIRAQAWIMRRAKVVVNRLCRAFGLNGPITDSFGTLHSDNLDWPMLESGRRVL